MPEIVARIAKLIRLSDSPNVNEAASAAAKAQELLRKHNLELADILMKGEDNKSLITMRKIPAVERAYDMRKWRLLLFGSVCQYNYCRALNQMIGGTGRRKARQMFLIVMGREIDIEVVLQVYHSLVNQMEVIANAEVKRQEAAGNIASNWKGNKNSRTWKASFLLGAYFSVASAMELEYLTAMKTNTTQKGLVVQTDKLIQEFQDDTFDKVRNNPIKASELAKDGPTDALRKGMIAGKDIKPRQGIEDKEGDQDKLGA